MLAGETVYDRPHQWGSKRTGPDLSRVGGRYTDEWHLLHLIRPRDLVPESNMPGFAWLQDKWVDGDLLQRKMRTLRMLGDPYSNEQIEKAPKAVQGASEMDALIAYLQFLGLANNVGGRNDWRTKWPAHTAVNHSFSWHLRVGMERP